ncbi:MAG TPA: sialate O-acetylesterase [Flavisolibacter sp.]|nr:sialate O-acetylesterase [Flavisolibacter sp.]
MQLFSAGKNIYKKLLLTLFLMSATQAFAQALKLPALFNNKMILQRGIEPPVWGLAAPNATINVSLNKVKRIFKANDKGRWSGKLPEPVAGTTYTLTITSRGEKKVFSDVIGGDVYFAGGQSNMQYSVSQMEGGEEEIAAAGDKQIRLFTVPRDISYRPRPDVNQQAKENAFEGVWSVASPESVKDFSAIAYCFAKKIRLGEQVPVGIINATWGGTPIEAHMSAEANSVLPYYADALKDMASKPVTDSLIIDKRKATPQLPASVFNAMINPVIPFGVKGCLWYQGEHNWNNPYKYREQFITFINDLRVRWKQGYLPFYFVQLPNMGKKPVNPAEDFLSVLRESQTMALKLPNTAMLVSLDIGDGDLHPKNKKAFGERLASIAQKHIYGKNIVVDGPVFTSYAVIRDTVEISFADNGSGLILKNDTAKVFSIAGRDNRFYWADVIIRNNKLLVYSAMVKNPQAVRYAWAENPSVTLFNKEGFPAPPFRTDAWQLKEDGKW